MNTNLIRLLIVPSCVPIYYYHHYNFLSKKCHCDFATNKLLLYYTILYRANRYDDFFFHRRKTRLGNKYECTVVQLTGTEEKGKSIYVGKPDEIIRSFIFWVAQQLNSARDKIG